MSAFLNEDLAVIIFSGALTIVGFHFAARERKEHQKSKK